MTSGTTAGAPLTPFPLPTDVLTKQKWTDTLAVSKETYGKGVWMRSSSGDFALRKPGAPAVSSLEAIRELIVFIIGRWLEVPMPTVELTMHQSVEPCSLCYDLPGHVYRWYNVMQMKLTQDLYARGKVALQKYAGRVIILDALVGGADRLNRGNHLFIDGLNQWNAIDYGQSFNRFPERDGVGDATMPFGQPPWQHVFPDIVEALRLSPAPYCDTLQLAKSIPPDRFDGLLALVPDDFASSNDRRDMIDFLKYRQANIETLLQDWCNANQLTGVLRCP